jgi:DNA-binding protein HU-beta
MNRNDLALRMVECTGLTARLARQVLDVLFGAGRETGLIPRALENEERVSISGFGTFAVRVRAARRVRNPRTGEWRQVPPTPTVVFRPGVALKDRLR